MTVSSAVTRNDYIATGGQTIFPYTFETFASSDLIVLQNGAVLSEGSQYTVSGVGLDAGGDITLLSGATASDAISVYLDMDLTRTTDYQNSGDFLASEVNDDFDRAWLATKQQQNSIDRSLRLPDADSTLDMALPVLASRKGTVLAFDETTGLPVVGPDIADVSSIASITADIARLADIEDGTLATNAIQTTAAISTNVTTVAGISANVTTVAGNTTNINTVAGNDANITTVAGVSAGVSTLAPISADITATASNAADISTVATNIVDVTNFADVYQGPSASDPTVRNDASALQTGDLYFNTTTNELRAYSGSAWSSTTSGSVSVTRFSGTGAQTAYTLPTAPSSENNTQVYIDGVYQQKDTYSVSGVTLTFSEAPPLDTDNIEVTTIESLALGATSSDLVSHIASGTGAVATTVQDKLRETVSVKDFGATGDGVTDDTVAIQAALDSLAITLYFPRGNYIINSQLVWSDAGVPLQLRGDGYLSSRITCNYSGVNILITKANVEFSGLRFNAGATATQPIAVRSALTTNKADCDVWFRDCWFNTGIHVAHQVVGRGSQFINCTLKSTTVMEITAPDPYVYSGSSPTQLPEGGMRRYRVVDCDSDGITTLVNAPNSTTADKYIHGLVISGNHFNGVDYLIRGQSCIDASIVNNTIGSTKNGTKIEALIAVKYLRNSTITGNYFAGWPNETVAATGRWNILISATNDPYNFADATSLNETLIENVIISGNVFRNLEIGAILSYGNIKGVTLTGNAFPEIFEFSNGATLRIISSRNYEGVQFVNNTLTTDIANVTGTPTYYFNYGSAGGNGAELIYGNTSDVTLVSNSESQFEIPDQGLAITGGQVRIAEGLKVANPVMVGESGTQQAGTTIEVRATTPEIRLATSDSSINDGETIGKITWNAPLEGSGANANIVAGSIELVSVGNWDSGRYTPCDMIVYTTPVSGPTKIEVARFRTSGILNLAFTPTYADNTAALAGGLVAGDVYRTATGPLMIAY
jgi:hypothetical protein